MTLAPIVPPVALMMARSPIVEQYDLSSVREIYCGGAPLGGGLVKELKERFPKLKRIRQGESHDDCPQEDRSNQVPFWDVLLDTLLEAEKIVDFTFFIL